MFVFYYLDGSVLDYYDRNRILHRLDGPAAVWNGNKEWHQNGKRHRLDGPAIIWANGYKSWWQNGKLHRISGPAIECPDYNAWYIDDRKLANKEEFEKTIVIMQLSGLLNG